MPDSHIPKAALYYYHGSVWASVRESRAPCCASVMY